MELVAGPKQSPLPFVTPDLVGGLPFSCHPRASGDLHLMSLRGFVEPVAIAVRPILSLRAKLYDTWQFIALVELSPMGRSNL